MEDSRFSSRKFLIAIISVVLINILTYLGTLDHTMYNGALLGVLGLYFTGNVSEKILNNVTNKP